MTVGPVISIVSGMPSGRLVDAWGSQRALVLGLLWLMTGALLMAFAPALMGVAGYIVALGVLTPGYQLFQAANNTAVLATTTEDRRGTVAGALNLSRNIGLIAGAWLMSALFARGVGTDVFARASEVAIAAGMRLTFLLAGGLMLLALAMACGRGTLLRCLHRL